MGSTGERNNPEAKSHAGPRSRAGAADAAEPGDEAEPAAALSWQEKELVNALRRVANARSQLATLQAEATEAAKAAHVAPADAEALAANHTELEAARTKAKGRLGGGGARKRLPALEATERQLLEKSRLAAYDDFVAWQASGGASSTVDLALLDFARREVAAATTALLQVQTLVIPEPEPVDDDADDGASAPVVAHPMAHPEAS